MHAQSCPTLGDPLDRLLSMRLSWQEYWSGFLFPPPRDPPNPEIKPASPATSALAGRFFTTEPPAKFTDILFVA